MSRLSDFLSAQRVDPRRLLVASKKLESATTEDLVIRLAKQRVKRNAASDTEKELAKKKGRSGKPVTKRMLDQALSGAPLTRRGKARVARAVNRVLVQKKKDTVAVSDIF